MMGIARMGGICVALNPALQVPEVDYSIKKVGVKAIITTEQYKTQNYYKMLMELFRGLNYDTGRIIVDSNKRLRFEGFLKKNELYF